MISSFQRLRNLKVVCKGDIIENLRITMNVLTIIPEIIFPDF